MSILYNVKDQKTGTIFDDYAVQDPAYVVGEEDTTHWTQVCDDCAEEKELPEDHLDRDIAGGICGCQDCGNEADHYYNFRGEEVPGDPECPACGSALVACVGAVGNVTYDGYKCPNGCNLFEHFNIE